MNNDDFIPDVPPERQRQYKDWLSRIRQYVRWLNMKGLLWFEGDINAHIKAYTDDLIKLGTLRPATIKARVSAVRIRYGALKIQEMYGPEIVSSYPKDMRDIAWANHFGLADEYPEVEFFNPPPKPKRYYIQLTTDLVSQFLSMPDTCTLSGLRDTALIALIMSSGLRESEVKLLTVDDLKLNDGKGEVGVHVPKGPASTERFIPFYEGFPVQSILKNWLSRADIQKGPVFRGFYRNEKSMRNTAITIQAIEDIFSFYPLTVEEIPIKLYVRPIHLRVFYAQLLYKLDFSLEVISENLGVKTQTGVNYIGTPSTELTGIPRLTPPKEGNYESEIDQNREEKTLKVKIDI